MDCRIAAEAEFDLDDIWYYLAMTSGNPSIADREVDKITKALALLTSIRTSAGDGMMICGSDCAALWLGGT